MQEIKKTRIVIASVLKPVDDVRMYEKLGRTLAMEGYEVFVVGYPSSGPDASSLVTRIPHSQEFKRFSLDRLLARVRILRIVFSIHPDIFIATTHELLPAAIWLRLFRGARIVYDVRENYFRNIKHSTSFPPTIRSIVARMVRLKEWITTPFVAHYFLAEGSYASEMSFLPAKRSTVLENKFDTTWLNQFPRKKERGYSQLLFSGTLASSTGVFDAIALTTLLHQLDSSVRLVVIGHTARNSVYGRLLTALEGKPFITLIGGNHLVPHSEIMEAIASADFGLILYESNPATDDKIPTKLYEYTGYSLPILSRSGPHWNRMIEELHAGIILPAEMKNLSGLLTDMKQEIFYMDASHLPSWQAQAAVLCQVLSGLSKEIYI